MITLSANLFMLIVLAAMLLGALVGYLEGRR